MEHKEDVPILEHRNLVQDKTEIDIGARWRKIDQMTKFGNRLESSCEWIVVGGKLHNVVDMPEEGVAVVADVNDVAVVVEKGIDQLGVEHHHLLLHEE